MCKKLTHQMIESITAEFYSQFCGIGLSTLKYGTHFVCSPERDEEVRGFGCKYTLYVLVKDHGRRTFFILNYLLCICRIFYSFYAYSLFAIVQQTNPIP